MVRAALRVLGFELKGLASIALWIVRRPHGVPPGASAFSYAKEQAFMLTLMLFAMAIETVVVDLLLVALGVPGWLRYAVLVADLYGLLFAVMLAAASANRPHVVTDGELRIRYAAYFDVRVPLDRIVSVRTGRNLNEESMISVADGRLAVAVGSQTNLTVELDGPVTVVRPLGRRAEVTSIRFFADDPEAVPAALRPRLTVPS
ncbi:hypothetical protein FE391_41425 [Nonomuraea sp. KC401]|uniref:PH domain-containing protein n=1 Tax=Nonomuraea longispora TaxID=1848320 RepID=A0A4R4MZP7_9ACTN|nr:MULTISPECIES: hypothetical protein [Nonomuraea]NBE99968.1 hypothetical protein [Nonomuraea sp. K271]TDC01798.1 hypothetical protein E1267_30885 [Nonomuraea longispora]TLF54787.1 hypothetical protein FE391_41425 [Nonomuraea sp. KC401]